MPGLDTALDTLKGLGSGFLLSFFFPTLLFTIVNLALWSAGYGIPDFETVAGQLGLSTATAAALALLLELTLAWILAPLSVPLRHVAEGELLPRWLQRIMLTPARVKAAAVERPKVEAREYLAEIRQLEQEIIGRLQAARRAANEGEITNAQAISKAGDAVEAFRLSCVATYDPAARSEETAEAIEDVAALLDGALRANDAALERPAGRIGKDVQDKLGWSETLDRAHTSFVNSLGDICREAHSHAEAASGPFDNNYASGDIRPSRLGNLRAVMEQYTQRAYGVSFAYMWPRVQAALAAENPIAQTLERAKNQLDFGIVMWFGTIVTAATWLVMLASSGGPVTLFLLVGLISPFLVGLFYRMACEGQKALTEAVRATTDLTRLDLLAKLGLTPPPSSAAERERWQSLQALSLGGSKDVELRVV